MIQHMVNHYLIANWKMHKLSAEALQFIAGFSSTSLPDNTAVIIAPSFPLLPVMRTAIEGARLPVMLAAQNMFYEEHGAFTGEVSPQQIYDAGAKYVIIGHSERRTLMNEHYNMLSQKLKAALTAELTPIYCLGENLQEREAGHSKEVVSGQVQQLVKDFSSADIRKMIIAYEPIWAIGTGKSATPEEVEEIHALMATMLPPGMPMVYGGSVNAQNAQQFLQQPHISGLLVGSASLDIQEFQRILAIF
ncbi:MAG: triose-phosphate isomerase [Candidatus Kerfeldbacteria bacterium]|nr:triose-phosphate isomerase [Candidatus Kerfeldbacteria bacterium]